MLVWYCGTTSCNQYRHTTISNAAVAPLCTCLQAYLDGWKGMAAEAQARQWQLIRDMDRRNALSELEDLVLSYA